MPIIRDFVWLLDDFKEIHLDSLTKYTTDILGFEAGGAIFTIIVNIFGRIIDIMNATI